MLDPEGHVDAQTELVRVGATAARPENSAAVAEPSDVTEFVSLSTLQALRCCL